MRVPNPLSTATHAVLPGPFAAQPSPDGIAASVAVRELAASQVRALLASSPSYHELAAPVREQLESDLVKISSYTAALIQDQFAQSEKLKQIPLALERTTVSPAARALVDIPGQTPKEKPAEEFSPRAASQVARITQETLNAIAFPTFVADLIKGTFQAIVDASIQQMEAFAHLLSNVAKTVDQFMADNISDNAARDYLASAYPSHFKVETEDDAPRVRVRDSASDIAKPNFQREFGLPADVDLSDESAEETLVPAARRKLAQNRHSLLATMVLMGMNRIVVTSGKIAAKMGFRINARDIARAQHATDFDTRHTTTVGAGGGLASLFGSPRVQSTTSIAYVSSTKKDSSDELNVAADLTGEVELKFKTDYLPLDRMATPEMISVIQGNTPNPAANTPTQTRTGSETAA